MTPSTPDALPPYNLNGECACETYHVYREVEGAGKGRQRRSMLECVATEGILTTALFSDLCLLGLSTTLLGCSAVSVPCSRALECSAVAAERVQCSSSRQCQQQQNQLEQIFFLELLLPS